MIKNSCPIQNAEMAGKLLFDTYKTDVAHITIRGQNLKQFETKKFNELPENIRNFWIESGRESINKFLWNNCVYKDSIKYRGIYDNISQL